MSTHPRDLNALQRAQMERDASGAPLRRWYSGRAPTREEVLEEIGRELAKRRNLYPKWIAERKYNLTQENADLALDRLQAAYDYIVEHWPSTQQSLLPE